MGDVSCETSHPADSCDANTNESLVDSNESETNNDISKELQFKKPVLLTGPRKGAHKFTKIKSKTSDEKVIDSSASSLETNVIKASKSPAELLNDQTNPLPYKEPSWALVPDRKYSLEVLKSGSIVETYELGHSMFVFGRSTASNCVLAHPSISRYHAVLQYGKKEEDSIPGYYLYDLSSTHGTFFNKSKIKPNLFVRLQVGHMLKLGLSTRMFILQGPPDDVEPESELSVTELKNLRLKEKLAAELSTANFEEAKDEGIDWGMGEDADEETDLSVNPFAAAPNEELYIDDPKKTLRGWFEREGEELEYDCQEKGFGQFVCRVQLPIDNSRGQSIVAEAIVKGKKKEAVVQCALEACRILDQHGLLRQSSHESRKKKAKDWEADDFYDSDEDTFLDRTGTVERKRQKRMEEAGVTQIVHTHPGLLAEHSRIIEEVDRVQNALKAASTLNSKAEESMDDELDKYMAGLVAESVDKGKISALKAELSRLKLDEARIRTLANIAKPAGTADLKSPWPSEEATAETVEAPPKPKMQMPMIGKRPKKGVKLQLNLKKATIPTTNTEAEGEEFDSD